MGTWNKIAVRNNFFGGSWDHVKPIYALNIWCQIVSQMVRANCNEKSIKHIMLMTGTQCELMS